MPIDADVVVIGGGIAGASVAYALVEGGAQTVLVDRRDPGRATDAGAGILSPETISHDDPDWRGLVLGCGAFYEPLVRTLEGAGLDPGWGRCGLLSLSVADWDTEVFEAVARGGVPEIPPADAVARFPALGEVRRALWNERAGRVDGRRMSAALTDAARDAGCVVIETGASTLSRAGRRVTAVETSASLIRCGAVVIAGGAWSPMWAGALGVPVGVRPVRGQIVHLRLEDVDTSAWPIAQPVFGHYLVPWPEGRVAIGATVEEAGFDARATAAGIRQLMSWTMRVAPGLADATFLEVRVGLRPFTADGLPLLGRVPTTDNVFVATGYGAEGLLLSPWCGHLVAGMVLGLPEEFDLSRFSLERVS